MKSFLCGAGLIALFIAGCSPRQMERSADKEVYSILEEKTDEVRLGVIPDTVIEQETPRESVYLDLRDAIVYASANNRAYESRREDVYLNILDLTYQRHRFTTRFGAGGRIGWRGGDTDDLVEARFNAGLVRWLSTGAEITLDIGKDFLRYLTGDRDTDIRTIISMNLIQPLLRGAGRAVAQEGLIQAERDAVYSIRSFLRFQKEFSVEVADRYLGLLLLSNRKENFHNNYESLKRTRERIEMLAKAGRIPAVQVDQARQNEYDAYQRWVNAVNRYNAALDSFKVYLGIKPDVEISLDENLLAHFLDRGIDDIDLELEDFMDYALSRRMDLLTQYDRTEDAKRKLAVAENNLRTRLDLRAGISARTDPSSSPTIDFRDLSYSAGLDFDLPVDRLQERNQYKRALIALQRAERDFENRTDSVKLEIIQQYRNLQEAYQSYLIQKGSLELARERIESINLLLEAGRATIRDLLEAEDSYVNAQNTLSSEIINYTVAYLRFLYMTEKLQVDEHGLWKGDLYEKITKADI